MAGCGGGSSSGSSNTPKTSGVKKRALISDRFNGQLLMVNAQTDTFVTVTGVSSDAEAMAVTPDKKYTIVLSPTSRGITVYDNANEILYATVSLGEIAESFATDSKTVYVPMRNYPNTGLPSGGVSLIDLTATTLTVTSTIPVPAARRVVLSHNGSKLLVFADNTNQVAVIDTASKAVTMVGGFDRPVNGVFSGDDSTAYIMSCGKECGGTAAKVNALSLANNTVGPDVLVSAATVGYLDGTTLYVAGTSATGGKLDTINTAGMTVSKSGVTISDGYHRQMALAGGRLFVAATSCSNVTTGCLSVYNTSAGTAVMSKAGTGDVTGLQPISDRNVVYVIAGGELVIWDIPSDAPQTKQLDIVGQAVDVKLID